MNFRVLRNLSIPALALAWFILPAGANAATASCAATPASLHGWYSILVAGGNPGGTSAGKYEVGAVYFDGVSKISGNNIYGAGTPVSTPSTASGTYSQNTDCTFLLNLTVASVPSTYTVAINNAGQAVGVETDATTVANIFLKPQYPTYVPVQNFNSSSLNGTYSAACIGALTGQSDLNLVTFTNGQLAGTDPFNNGGGELATSNNPYSGTYTVNSDGTFAGSLLVSGIPFDYYGVIDSSNTELDYIYANVAGGVPGAAATNVFASCTGSVAPAASTTVNLAPYYNVSAVTSDGRAPADGGLSGSNYTYSANLLPSSVTWNGLVFPIGPANALNAVSNKTVTLPAGKFSTLNILGAADYGPMTGTIVVTYTDGTTSSFSQGFSDWSLTYLGVYNPKPNESIAAATAYRVTPSGGAQAGPWYVFGYSFPLTNTKTVASLKLPANSDIFILSAALQP
jgi:hypothetical protein